MLFRKFSRPFLYEFCDSVRITRFASFLAPPENEVYETNFLPQQRIFPVRDKILVVLLGFSFANISGLFCSWATQTASRRCVCTEQNCQNKLHIIRTPNCQLESLFLTSIYFLHFEVLRSFLNAGVVF